MIGEAVAAMVDGASTVFGPLNRWHEARGDRQRACAVVALTGAATTWRGPPRLFIGLRLGDAPAKVACFALDDGLAGQPEERIGDIQRAIGHAPEMLRDRLAVVPVPGGAPP